MSEITDRELAQAIIAYSRNLETQEQLDAVKGISTKTKLLVLEAHAIGFAEAMDKAMEAITA